MELESLRLIGSRMGLKWNRVLPTLALPNQPHSSAASAFAAHPNLVKYLHNHLKDVQVHDLRCCDSVNREQT